jgi:hypothetical protein
MARTSQFATLQAAEGSSQNAELARLANPPILTDQKIAWLGLTGGESGAILRRCSCHKSGGDECEECKAGAKSLHRSASGLATASAGAVAPPIVHDVLRTPGQPLDTATRGFMESRLGYSFDHIRVHTDDRAAESARAVDALAFSVGRDLVFDRGEYAPHTAAGARLLAHELAHAVQSPEPVGMFPFLRVGAVEDPAEQAAERTADAVMRGESVALAPLTGGVVRRQRRQCTASAADRPDQRIVSCTDGDYRVTLTTEKGPPRPDTRTSVNAGYNSTAIYLTIGICHGGTSVQIKPSLDLPRAVVKAIGNVLAGSGALSGAKLSPGLEITIAQSESFTLTLEPTVTVDQQGVSGGGLKGSVKTSDVDASVSATYDARTRAGFLTFTISGGTKQKKIDCTKEGEERLVFQCEKITHIPKVPEVKEQKTTDTETRYLFFKYPTAEIRRNFRLPTDIGQLLESGYRVATIDGYTSPEGPRDKGPGFEGNITLGQERADAAKTWLEKEICPTCDLSGVTPLGHGELPSGVGTEEPETKGPKMEREAVEEFLGNAPGSTADPLAPKDPDERAKFAKLPQSQQRERAFELMRRAAITLERTRVTQPGKPEVPARDEFNSGDCPDDVIEAARTSFGISIMTGATVK